MSYPYVRVLVTLMRMSRDERGRLWSSICTRNKGGVCDGLVSAVCVGRVDPRNVPTYSPDEYTSIVLADETTDILEQDILQPPLVPLLSLANKMDGFEGDSSWIVF